MASVQTLWFAKQEAFWIIGSKEHCWCQYTESEGLGNFIVMHNIKQSDWFQYFAVKIGKALYWGKTVMKKSLKTIFDNFKMITFIIRFTFICLLRDV